MAKYGLKIYFSCPNEHHCPMCFYVFQSWQKANQERSAGQIWSTGLLLRTHEQPHWLTAEGGRGEAGGRVPTSIFLATNRGKRGKEKKGKDGKCRRKWGKMEKKWRKNLKSKGENEKCKGKKAEDLFYCFSLSGNHRNFFGSTKMEIFTGKKLKSCWEKWLCPPPPKNFPVTPLSSLSTS